MLRPGDDQTTDYRTTDYETTGEDMSGMSRTALPGEHASKQTEAHGDYGTRNQRKKKAQVPKYKNFCRGVWSARGPAFGF